MKTVIGLIGENGSGKETFVDLFTEHVGKEKVTHLRTVGILHETLDLWKIEQTRKNLQVLAIQMEIFGAGTLTNALRSRVEESQTDFVIYDCIRWQSDLNLVTSFPHHLLVYVTADPKIRWERTRKRNKKIGEGKATFEEFLENEKRATETQIKQFGAQADFTITNNSSLEEFKSQVSSLFTKRLS